MFSKDFSLTFVCVAALAVCTGCSTDNNDAAQESVDASDSRVGSATGVPSTPDTALDAGAASDSGMGTGPVDVAALLGLDDSAFPYIYFERDKALLSGVIDYDATLNIAEIELKKGGATSVITIWAIRDQLMPAASAARIGKLYFEYIDGPGLHIMQSGFGYDFAVWHFAWAMGNIYRLGPDDVKAAIQTAYDDALARPKTLKAPYDAVLKEQLTGDRIYMGDAHNAGRGYAQAHVVISGNPAYLQSFGDYMARQTNP